MISDGVAAGVFSISAVGARRLASLFSVLSSSADGAAASISSRSAYAVADVVMVRRRCPTRGLFRGAVGAGSRGSLCIVFASTAHLAIASSVVIGGSIPCEVFSGTAVGAGSRGGLCIVLAITAHLAIGSSVVIGGNVPGEVFSGTAVGAGSRGG